MRIISQSGTFDLPYDKCIVWINNGKIMARPIGEPDSDYVFGNYSTCEKAEKAMRILYETRNVHEVFKNIDPESQLKMLEAVEGKTGFEYGGVFQFPKEEDL